MVTVRPRTAADLDGCIEVLRHVHADSGYPVQGMDNAEAFLTEGRVKQAWIAEDDRHVIGHVAVSTATDDDVSVALWRNLHPDNDSIVILERLFVHPERHGGGIATQLIKTAMAWGLDAGCRLVLFALVKDQAAMNLYKRLGWHTFGKTNYHWGDGEHMEAICFVSPQAG